MEDFMMVLRFFSSFKWSKNTDLSPCSIHLLFLATFHWQHFFFIIFFCHLQFYWWFQWNRYYNKKKKNETRKKLSKFCLQCFGSEIREWASFVFDGIEHGFVTDIPNILPGGNASIGLPVSFDTKRNAIASSTACCLFNATCKNSIRMY